MDLAGMKQEVYTLTNRPDRVNETATAIRSATLKAHLRDFYWRDLIELQLDLGGTAMVWQLAYKGISPRWRANKYLRKFDPTTDTPGDFLSLVPPELVLDSYALAKQDIYYYAGDYLNINSSTLDRYYLYGFYNLPDITDSTFDSWIADDYPYAIIYDATATVFKSIGKDEEAAQYKSLVPEQMALIDISNIQVQGY